MIRARALLGDAGRRKACSGGQHAHDPVETGRPGGSTGIDLYALAGAPVRIPPLLGWPEARGEHWMMLQEPLAQNRAAAVPLLGG